MPNTVKDSNNSDMNFIDRTISFFSPSSGLKRAQYRTALQLMTRRYEAAAAGRRTSGWSTQNTGPNAINEMDLNRLRGRSRDLYRNNVWAKNAVRRVAANVVGTGIQPNIKNKKVKQLWKEWAETKACDFYGQQNIYGLQRQAMEAVVRDGEVIIRRRRVKGGTVPLKLQIQEADVIDSTRSYTLIGGGEIIQGIEYDADGQRVAYWLYDYHPNDNGKFSTSRRIPADDVIHIYEVERPGQVRGVPWLAATMLRLKDFDDYEDAELVRQKIAACFTVFVQDANPDNPAGSGDALDIERVEPGIVEMLPPGKTVTFATPPTTQNFDAYSRKVLLGAAAGVGLSYESMTGDLSNVNFSSGRMGWIEMQRNVESWQYNMLVPMMCDAVWEWFMAVGFLAGKVPQSAISMALWTPPRREMIDPGKELTAQANAIRSGLLSLQEVHRQNGYDSETILSEMAEDNKKIDELGLVLDSDPRKTMKAGVVQPYFDNLSQAGSGSDPVTE